MKEERPAFDQVLDVAVVDEVDDLVVVQARSESQVQLAAEAEDHAGQALAHHPGRRAGRRILLILLLPAPEPCSARGRSSVGGSISRAWMVVSAGAVAALVEKSRNSRQACPSRPEELVRNTSGNRPGAEEDSSALRPSQEGFGDRRRGS
jgi:hypothetical protein